MDPAILAALAQSFSQQGTPDAAAEAEAGPSPPVAVTAMVELLAKLLRDDDEDEGRAAKLARCRQRAWKKLSRLQRSMSLLSRRNAFVAGALGACECWGADDTCERCQGQGAPGAFEPVASAFDALVVPLFRRRSSLLQEFVVPTPLNETKAGPTVH